MRRDLRAVRAAVVDASFSAQDYPFEGEQKGAHESRTVIQWLTGFDEAVRSGHLAAQTTFEDLDDPLMQKIRYLDKLVDELARSKAMVKVLRT